MRSPHIRLALLAAAAVMLVGNCTMRGLAWEVDPVSPSTGIQMDVSQTGQNIASYAVGEPHSWVIRCQIPEDIAGAGQYAVTQTLDPGLTMEKNSVQVCLYTGEEDTVPLRMEDHYTLVLGTVREGDVLTERICVSLTPAGAAWLSDRLNGGIREPELQITYRACINGKASMGTQIIGSAQLNYTDPNGGFSRTYSDKPYVYTGGVHLLLTDPKNQPLSGGTFMLARDAEKFEKEGQPLAAELLDTGTEQIAVVYESFFTTQSMDGEKQSQVTTGPDGTAILYGLPFGEYYLVQTAAPKGMQMRGTPLIVRINEVSHLTLSDEWRDGKGKYADHTVHIVNAGISIPSTGGPGTTAITAAGIAVLLSAALLLFCNHRKEYK